MRILVGVENWFTKSNLQHLFWGSVQKRIHDLEFENVPALAGKSQQVRKHSWLLLAQTLFIIKNACSERQAMARVLPTWRDKTWLNF